MKPGVKQGREDGARGVPPNPEGTRHYMRGWKEAVEDNYLKQTFSPRALPQMVSIIGPDPRDPEMGAEDIIGPFCRHCGNPLSLHGPRLRCPNRHLHPLFPPPALPVAEEEAA